MTTKTVIRSAQTGDSYYRISHASGLEILVCEMPGYSTTDAIFATKYGSINTTFRTKNEPDFVTVPEGIAHYLEHKLFENEDTDVFELYAKTGANGNAFTSFERTAYFFSCADNFLPSLEILLNFVQAPYFTQENVDKEQGIIAQEIRMYDDDPGWQVFFNMLGGLYSKHPVRIDIAGTVESIAQITPALLYRCYNTFYNLHNMVLTVAGNCKVDEVIEMCDRLLKPCEDIELVNHFEEETLDALTPETVVQAPVGLPLFHLGFKLPPKKGMEALRADYTARLALDTFIGTSTPLYREILAAGLSNDTFGAEIFSGDGYSTIYFSGESIDPRALRERLLAEAQKLRQTGLDPVRFEAVKKSAYGDLIEQSMNVESVAMGLMDAHFVGVGYFDHYEVLGSITRAECEEFLLNALDPAHMTLSIVEPLPLEAQ